MIIDKATSCDLATHLDEASKEVVSLIAIIIALEEFLPPAEAYTIIGHLASLLERLSCVNLLLFSVLLANREEIAGLLSEKIGTD